jgi:SWI/SNF-related matrix-associated actin-dependent regulator 1 of chromatin subfamily A
MVEKQGEKMVEDMLVKQIKGEDREDDQTKSTKVKDERPAVKDAGDLKDAFKKGLEGEGLKIESKQAQY